MRRLLAVFVLVAGLAAPALAGCGQPAPAPKAKPKPAFSFAFEQKSADAEVRLILDREIGEWPVLHRRLYRDGLTELRKFAADAPALRADSVTPEFTPPVFQRELRWQVAAASPRVVSLRQSWMEYTGGAHPNHGAQGLLWSVVEQAETKNAELFVSAGPADAALDQRLCDAIKAARAAKGVEPDAQAEAVWPCPKWRDADLELAPSTVPGKFGGVTFLFDPYAIGSYAEGEYEITIPQSALRAVLAPGWAGEFAGEPKVKAANPAAD